MPAGPASTGGARAVQMTVKNPVDGEEQQGDTMAQRVSAVQAEFWRRHKWVDENSEEAWEEYKHLLVGGGNFKTAKDWMDILPELKSTLTPEEYLDVISAPLDASKLAQSKTPLKSDLSGKGREKVKGKGKEVTGGEHDAMDIDRA